MSGGRRGAMCITENVGCMQPRCGAVGTVVRIRWSGIDCGNFSHQTTVNCEFGGVAVPSTSGSDSQVGFCFDVAAGELLADALYCLRSYGFILDGSPPCVSTWLLQGRYIECAAPQPLAPLTSSNMTVLLRLLLLSPVAAPGDQWRGIGYPAINIHDNMAVTVVDVTSVYDIDLVVGSNSSTSSTRRLRRAAVASGDWRPMVYGDKFMFTYTVNGERCGCDVDSTSTCDGCGRYRPTPWLPNLAI